MAGLGKPRLVAGSLAVAALIAVAVVVLLNRDTAATSLPPKNETAGAPSPRAELNQSYRFQVGHCGLRHVVEFDGSIWDVDPFSMTEEEDGRFGINGDTGTMTLRAADVAVYRSFRGGEATLRRHIGEKSVFLCD